MSARGDSRTWRKEVANFYGERQLIRLSAEEVVNQGHF